LLDPEIENFTYALANEGQLVEFLAETLTKKREEVEEYAAEMASDPELNRSLRKRLRRRWDRKHRPHFGRRMGWYVIARALKPSVIVETGIHDGLGSVLLLRALDRNAEEGVDGRLISFDVNPNAGWLVGERLRKRWEPVYEATSEALEPHLEGVEVGMIIHDSEHTYECEYFELTTAVSHASPTIALVSDNAHATTALRDIATDLASTTTSSESGRADISIREPESGSRFSSVQSEIARRAARSSAPVVLAVLAIERERFRQALT